MGLFDRFIKKNDSPDDVHISEYDRMYFSQIGLNAYDQAKAYVEQHYKPPRPAPVPKPEPQSVPPEYVSSDPVKPPAEPPADSSVKYSISVPDSSVRYSLSSNEESYDTGSVYTLLDAVCETDSVRTPDINDLYSRSMLSSPFSKLLNEHMSDLGVTSPEVYKRAQIDKTTFSKMLSNPYYSPTKDTAIAVCIGLTLNLQETDRLLKAAGYTLSTSILRDVVIRYCIESHIFNVISVNCLLEKFDCRPLGRN